MSKLLKKFAVKIQRFRVSLNLEQKDWGKLCGYKDGSSISDMEKGMDLYVSTLLKRLDCLDYTIAIVPLYGSKQKVNKKLQQLLRFYPDHQIILVVEQRRCKRVKRKNA